MKLIELIEARRNPEQNPKIGINQIIADKADETSDRIAQVKNLFVSFTSVDKLGINPGSKYNTPLGIYAYPAEYVIDSTGGTEPMDTLPFAGEQPHVNVFSATGNIINVALISPSTVRKYYVAIAEYWAEVSGKDWKTSVDMVEGYVDDAAYLSKFRDIPGGQFWYVTRAVATELLAPLMNSSPPVAWNRLMREIEIDGVVDYDPDRMAGLGIIHMSEPSQAVFFSRAAISNEERHLNKYSPSSVDAAKDTGAKRHAAVLDAAAALAKQTTIDGIVTVVLNKGYWVIRLIKDPEMRLRVIQRVPATVLRLTSPTVDEQAMAISESRHLISDIKNLSQSAIIKAFALNPALKLPARALVIDTLGRNVDPELQQQLVRLDHTVILEVNDPAPAAIRVAVHSVTSPLRSNKDGKIIELAAKYGVPYHWELSKNYENMKSRYSNISSKIDALPLHTDDPRVDKMRQDLEREAELLKYDMAWETSMYANSIEGKAQR